MELEWLNVSEFERVRSQLVGLGEDSNRPLAEGCEDGGSPPHVEVQNLVQSARLRRFAHCRFHPPSHSSPIPQPDK